MRMNKAKAAATEGEENVAHTINIYGIMHAKRYFIRSDCEQTHKNTRKHPKSTPCIALHTALNK